MRIDTTILLFAPDLRRAKRDMTRFAATFFLATLAVLEMEGVSLADL